MNQLLVVPGWSPECEWLGKQQQHVGLVGVLGHLLRCADDGTPLQQFPIVRARG